MSNRSPIETQLTENRTFPAPAAADVGFPRWHIGSEAEYLEQHRRSIEDPAGFYGDVAKELNWFEPWREICSWELPDARWFDGAVTNLCHNAVDRHVDAGHGDATALIWEGEPVDADSGAEQRSLTYAELKAETARFANVLDSQGVKKGDVVTIYMGMVPELAIAVLACARIGAPHSVIFGGFSAQSIADRVIDAKSSVVLTCDGGWRRGKIVPLKDNVDEACAKLADGPNAVERVIVFARTKHAVEWDDLRDRDWAELCLHVGTERAPEPMAAEDPLFLLYTSGSTGKPKGILHTTAGYMVHAYLTAKLTFNLIPDDNQVFWCTADVGWITGHTYILYGVLANRVPTLMYEGAPDSPDPKRFWDICERHAVTQFYTAPTAIRAFMKWGDEHPAAHDLSKLRLLGTVGEPINPEAWIWYRRVIGRDLLPIVDTWWQTETGGHMLTPLPGVTATKPGSCSTPMLGVDAAVVDPETGEELPANQGGVLVVRKPWPGMLRGIYGDRQRFIDTYWDADNDYYITGDGARRDADGDFWIMGRTDDVINVSGHRIGTMEVESALVSHPDVVEAAVVGMPHEIKGTGIAAFCTLTNAAAGKSLDEVAKSLRAHVTAEIGAFAKPDALRFAAGLPKTRSGKIMRRLLRDVAAGAKETSQDTTTLEDRGVLGELLSAEAH